MLPLEDSCCIYFMQTSLYTCCVCNTEFHRLPLVANKVAIRKYVALTKAITGRFRMPLKTPFIDSTRFVVMWPHLAPSSYDLVHLALSMLSIHLPASGFVNAISRR